MLLINDFEKKYEETLVLSISSQSFDAGVYWIRGENGSGKSSLFRSLAGIIPCSGHVRFDDGISLHRDPVQYRRNVNFSEAEPLFPGFLNARDIIRFVSSARKVSTEEQRRVASHFGVDQFLTKPCSTYSSGMLKRLSLCLAFLGTCRLIILDEPLITLDAEIRRKLFERIKASVTDSGTTFLMSSHETITAEDLALSGTFYVTGKTLVA